VIATFDTASSLAAKAGVGHESSRRDNRAARLFAPRSQRCSSHWTRFASQPSMEFTHQLSDPGWHPEEPWIARPSRGQWLPSPP
jgi:hypothetical protein